MWMTHDNDAAGARVAVHFPADGDLYPREEAGAPDGYAYATAISSRGPSPTTTACGATRRNWSGFWACGLTPWASGGGGVTRAARGPAAPSLVSAGAKRSGDRAPTRLQALAAGGVITAAVIFGSAAPAMAASPARAAAPSACNTQIIDDTPGTVLRSDGNVAQAMAQLEAKGADVRIRVLTAAPGGSLDAYEASQVRDCPSWSLNGGIKPNLVVFLVSLDHQDAVFYGANYSRLQGHVDQIRADMGGDFRSGDFAAGIAQGEQETYSALYPSGTPASAGHRHRCRHHLVLGIAVCAIAGRRRFLRARPQRVHPHQHRGRLGRRRRRRGQLRRRDVRRQLRPGSASRPRPDQQNQRTS